MTSFAVQEITIDQSAKMDLFEFRHADKVFRRVNQDFPVTISGVDYLPSTIVVSAVKASAERIQNEIKISLPRNDEIVVPYLAGLPGTVTSLVMSQAHWDGYNTVSDKRAYWSGDALAVSWDGSEATLTFQNTMSSMNKIGLRRKYQSSCSHFLYRGGCELSIAAHTTSYQVMAESGTVLTIPSLPADCDKFTGGVAQWNGQFRMIYSVDYPSRTIVLLQPFDGLVPPDIVGLALGCDRALATCVTKFNNLTNFGGFPYIPDENYFLVGLK